MNSPAGMRQAPQSIAETDGVPTFIQRLTYDRRHAWFEFWLYNGASGHVLYEDVGLPGLDIIGVDFSAAEWYEIQERVEGYVREHWSTYQRVLKPLDKLEKWA
jgi:hypothetical protein